MNINVNEAIGRSLMLMVGVCVAFALGHAAGASGAPDEHEVLSLERGALARWGKGDPGGLLDVYSQDITYFDQSTKKRIDGHAAMENYYRPLTGKIHWSKWEIIDPKVQQYGDVAVLTYSLHAEGMDIVGAPGEAAKKQMTDWNSTSVYTRIDGKWRMIHSHWTTIANKLL